jgi:glycosyltransferase involved in cell wall biosynthesis
MSVHVLIAIITYNEEQNICKTITQLQQSKPNADIVLVYNDSKDATVKIAKELGISAISLQVNTGNPYGNVKAYFLYAYEKGYDLVCQFDGDGQHRSEELSKILKSVIEGNAHLVIGSRRIEKKGFQSTFYRRIGISVFSLLS